jgi:predicted RNA-binding Zn-ribbon protein involved in translation (DUF1610 family)
MEVRIKFNADIVITGDTMEQVRSKFESMPLWSEDAKECGVEFSEIQLVEDANTYNDLEYEYNNCYSNECKTSVCPESEWKENVCPECGHVFKQGESNYNYDTGHTDFECPECGWCGNEFETKGKEEF